MGLICGVELDGAKLGKVAATEGLGVLLWFGTSAVLVS